MLTIPNIIRFVVTMVILAGLDLSVGVHDRTNGFGKPLKSAGMGIETSAQQNRLR